MHQIPLRLAISLPLSAAALGGGLISTCAAQANVAPQENGGPTGKPEPNPKYEGLPTFLLEVPGGTVDMGLTAIELFEAACQTAFPPRPEMAVKTSEKAVTTAMRRTASALGPKKVEVDTFLLSKWPVKASEYEVFVALSRAEGTELKPVRPPFGWWRFGRKDDYNARLAEINQMFPKNRYGPLLYWEAKGHELPYKLEDERGDSIVDHPVGHISYSEANRFAAWLGMRLPSEEEWTRAARADGSHLWPWGAGDPEKDKFLGRPSLEAMQLFDSRDKRSKPAGTVKTAIGPYGHVDMFGSIWQLVAGTGYSPINGADAFAAEWKTLQKDKRTRDLLKAPPAWKDIKVLSKGGSYLSAEDPIQLLIDQRAPLLMDDVLESVGFRLAKSLRPGYDTLYSLLRGVYNKNRFLPDQEIVLDDQVGTERYELTESGFPKAYQTVSFARSNWLSKGKRGDLKKIMESSYRNPLLLGTLVTTEKVEGLQSEDQIFSVFYRTDGQPRELSDAMKRGYREVQAELKAAAKRKKAGVEEKDDEKEDDKKKKAKKDDWREILKRYGLTPKDLEPPEAKNGVDFVRIDGVVVKTDRAAYMLQDNEGKIVVSIPAPNARPVAAKAFDATLRFEGNGDGMAVAKFEFGVPFVDADEKRVVHFHMHLPLVCGAPTPEKPWRLPN